MKRTAEAVTAWLIVWGACAVVVITAPEDAALLAAVLALIALPWATSRGNGAWWLSVLPIGVGLGVIGAGLIFQTDFRGCSPEASFEADSVGLFGRQVATCGGIDPAPYFVTGSIVTLCGIGVLGVVLRRRKQTPALSASRAP